MPTLFLQAPIRKRLQKGENLQILPERGVQKTAAPPSGLMLRRGVGRARGAATEDRIGGHKA